MTPEHPHFGVAAGRRSNASGRAVGRAEPCPHDARLRRGIQPAGFDAVHRHARIRHLSTGTLHLATTAWSRWSARTRTRYLSIGSIVNRARTPTRRTMRLPQQLACWRFAAFGNDPRGAVRQRVAVHDEHRVDRLRGRTESARWPCSARLRDPGQISGRPYAARRTGFAARGRLHRLDARYRDGSATGTLNATPGAIIRLIAFRDYVIAFKGTRVPSRTGRLALRTREWLVVSTKIGLVGHDAV